MAKKNDAAFDAYLAELKELFPGIEEGLKDERVASKLRDGVLARSEFSSQMDALKSEREKFEAYQSQERTKIDGWQKWYGDVSKEAATIQEKLAKYEEAYGPLEASTNHAARTMGISKEDLAKELDTRIQQRDVAALKFVDDLTDLKIEHRDRFKEKLDTASVYKIAGEKNLPLDVAYQLYIGDRVEELRKTEVEDRIKKAREEGAAEALAKHNLPVIPSNPDYVHPFDIAKPLTDANDRIAAATKHFLENRNRV